MAWTEEDDAAFNSLQPSQTVSAKLPTPRKATSQEENRYKKRNLWEHFVRSLGAGVLDNAGAMGDLLPRAILPGAPDVTSMLPRGARPSTAAETLIEEGNLTPPTHNKAEEYAQSIGRNVGRALVPVAGAETSLGRAALETVAAGVGAGTAGQAAHDYASENGMNPETARMLGEILGGSVAGVGTGKAVRKVSNNRLINAGVNHPDFEALVSSVVPELEGGGTIAHPRTSPKGASGPMQVMPGTSKSPGFGIRKSNGTAEDDVRVGQQYLAAMLGKYKDPDLALAAYNWGPGNLDRALKAHGENWFDHAPRETQHYVVNGMEKLLKEGRPNGSTRGPVPPMDPRSMAEAMGDQGMLDALDSFDENQTFPQRGERLYQELIDGKIDAEEYFARREKLRNDYELSKVAQDNEPAPDLTDIPRIKEEGLTGDNVVDLGTVRQTLDNQKTRNLLDEKLDSASSYEDAIHNDEIQPHMTPEWATENRVTAEKMHDLLPEDHPYKAKTQQLVDTWRSIEDNIFEAKKPFKDHLTAFIQKNLEAFNQTPDNKALRDIANQWDNLLEDLKSGKISADEYDAKIAPLQAAHTAILKRMDQQHADYIKGTQIENQSHDASVPTKPVDNTGYEKHTPFVGEPKTPANDLSNPDTPGGGGGKGRRKFKDIIANEEGTLKGDEPTEGTPEGPKGNEPEIVRKLRAILETAQPLAKEQAKARSKVRGERIQKVAQTLKAVPGEKGHYAALGQLKGELPKKTMKPRADEFSQEDLDSLFDVIAKHPRLNLYEKVDTQGALVKLLKGEVPTEREISLLSEVLAPDIVDNLKKKGFLRGLADVLNVPRSVMASFDLSAPFRQGVFLVGRKEFWKNFPAMFKAAFSEKDYQAIQDSIRARPSYSLMKQARVAFTDLGENLTNREEQFMSDLAERWTGGKYSPVRASSRAYIAFLNKLRADVFDSLVTDAKEAGINFREKPRTLQNIGRFVNVATGRGSLGALNQAAPLLSATFFSPRLMASRVTLLNPAYYARLDPFTRKQALKSLFSFTSIALTTLGLAHMAGLGVETDWKSADFAKIRVGNTRYDITGGLQPYIVLAARLITGESKNSNTGEVKDLTSGDFGQPTRADVVERFFATKESPIASFIHDWLRGKDVTGKKFDLTDEAISRIVPLMVQDVHDAYNEWGTKGLLNIIPATFGVSVQTYKQRPKKKKDPFDHAKAFKSSKPEDLEKWFKG